MTGKDKGRAWWQEIESEPVTVPSFEVDDVRFVQPPGFVWFQKPRYRVKAVTRIASDE